MINIVIPFSNLPKIGVEVAKEKYEVDANSSTSKKATIALEDLKNYFCSNCDSTILA